MQQIDFLMVYIYLMVIYSTLTKHKTTITIYRTLKFLAMTLVVYLVFLLVRMPLAEWTLLRGLLVLPILVVSYLTVQTEARLILHYLGIKTGLLRSNTIEENVKLNVIKSVEALAKDKIGALITFERSVRLDEYIQTSFAINAPVNPELLTTIFIPKTPLHDGAVIIKGSQIVCAGAYFPTSENPDIPKYLGSRHRAAIGISEVTDALTIIVSEQTGQISIAIDGYLDEDISKESLILYIEKYLQN